MAVRTTPSKPRVSLDRSIERMRKQLAEFAPFLGKGKQTRSLEEFDLETERLIEELLGQALTCCTPIEYAELGEAAGLVNMTDEAPEGTGMDSQRQSLLQRGRVLESCVSNWKRAGLPTDESQDCADAHRPADRRTHVYRSPERVARCQSATGRQLMQHGSWGLCS